MIIGKHQDKLLDTILEMKGFRFDAQITRATGIFAPTLSKVRANRIGIPSTMLCELQEYTGLHVRQMRELAGIEPQPKKGI